MGLIRGRSYSRTCIAYLDEVNNITADLTDAVIKAMVKSNPNQPDDDALFTKEIGDGVEITDAANGAFTVTITPLNSNSLPYNRVYIEIAVSLVSGTILSSGIIEESVKGNVIKELF